MFNAGHSWIKLRKAELSTWSLEAYFHFYRQILQLAIQLSIARQVLQVFSCGLQSWVGSLWAGAPLWLSSPSFYSCAKNNVKTANAVRLRKKKILLEKIIRISWLIPLTFHCITYKDRPKKKYVNCRGDIQSSSQHRNLQKSWIYGKLLGFCRLVYFNDQDIILTDTSHHILMVTPETKCK